MPLNIFEPRYLALFDDALSAERLVGIIQPQFDSVERAEQGAPPPLCRIGGLGRITSFSETGDGRYLVSLSGICRFSVDEEEHTAKPYRRCRITPFVADLAKDNGAAEVDRDALLKSFRAYLEANELEADWSSIEKASNTTLVNALSMMSPYGPAEKQALLEAPDLKSRAETLIAITEIELARNSDDFDQVLQ